MEEKGNKYGTIQGNKVILNGWGEYPDREIGEVKDDNPDHSFHYFEERYKELETKISDLEKTIEESINKGSFLMKLLHLKEVIPTHEGLGDYQSLLDKLLTMETLLQEVIAKNREKNSELKKTLISEVQIAADKFNWKEATEEIHDIKTRWIKTGNALEEEQEQLEESFWAIVSGFFEKKKAFYEDKKRLGEKNKVEYEHLVKEAEKLVNIHGKERFEKVKELKDLWAELGNIPKEEYGPLVDLFNKHLKPTNRPQPQTIDLKALIKELDGYLSGTGKVNLKTLEGYRSQLKTYLPAEYKAKQERKEAFSKIQLLKEWDFLINVSSKRLKTYKELDAAEQRKLEIKVLEDLLVRDREDLAKYLSNSGNFTSASGQMNPIIEKKLTQQKMKVAIKEQLLAMLNKF
ncbi:MAG: hypothetical protein ACJA08_000623 [Cyclobacteriaceae bacterium]